MAPASDPAAQAAPVTVDHEAEALIARCADDPRTVVADLLTIVRLLEDENRVLRRAASPGFARHSLDSRLPLSCQDDQTGVLPSAADAGRSG